MNSSNHLVNTFLGRTDEDWEAIGTAALVFVTTVLAWYTARLFGATKRLSEEAVSRDRVLERAYVFGTVEWKDRGDPAISRYNGPAEFLVRFKNNGRTPALMRNLRATYIVDKTAPNAFIENPHAHDMPRGLVIESGKEHIEVVSCSISANERQDISSLSKILYIMARLEYDDVLGVKRHTSICWEYRERNNGPLTHIVEHSSLNSWT